MNGGGMYPGMNPEYNYKIDGRAQSQPQAMDWLIGEVYRLREELDALYEQQAQMEEERRYARAYNKGLQDSGMMSETSRASANNMSEDLPMSIPVFPGAIPMGGGGGFGPYGGYGGYPYGGYGSYPIRVFGREGDRSGGRESSRVFGGRDRMGRSGTGGQGGGSQGGSGSGQSAGAGTAGSQSGSSDASSGSAMGGSGAQGS